MLICTPKTGQSLIEIQECEIKKTHKKQSWESRFRTDMKPVSQKTGQLWYNIRT